MARGSRWGVMFALLRAALSYLAKAWVALACHLCGVCDVGRPYQNLGFTSSFVIYFFFCDLLLFWWVPFWFPKNGFTSFFVIFTSSFWGLTSFFVIFTSFFCEFYFFFSPRV